MKNKRKKTVEQFNSYDFVQRYVYLYKCYYNANYRPELPQDTTKMKRAMDEFTLHGLNKRDFSKFLEWAMDQKAFEKKTRMTIGLLKHLTKEYLKKKGATKNIYDMQAKKDKKQMNKELQDWVEKEKKRIKKLRKKHAK